MSRILITDPFPVPPADIPADVTVVVPHSGVSRPLRVPASSLQTIAKDLLKRNGCGIATPIRSSAALKQAVRSVMPHQDASAIAAHHRQIIGSMLRSGVDLKKLAQAGSLRARDAARIAKRYVDILDRDRLIDSEAALMTALRREVIQPRKSIIYGYFRARQLEARPEEIEFIDRLSDDGSIFYLPCGNEPLFAENRRWVDLLVDRGWYIQEVGRNVDGSSPIRRLASRFALGGHGKVDDFEAVEYADLENEVRGTLARAKSAALRGLPLDQIAIVCRDLELYSPQLIAAAREYSLPVNIDAQVPLGQTAFGELVTLLFETLELRTDQEIASNSRTALRGFQYESTLRLMLHRFGPGLSAEDRAAAYARRPSSLDGWRAGSKTADQFVPAGDRDAAAWANWLRTLFSSWNMRSAEKLAGSAADLIAYDRFFDALEEHSRHRDSSDIPLSEFAFDVWDVLANISTPLHTERGGIKVLLPNVAVGCDFSHIFIIGMAEGILPAWSSDNTVIDFCEREKLRRHGVHFENALEVPRWEALTFYFTLLAATEKIVFSYPRFADDTERLKSAYFKRIGLDPARRETPFISSAQEYRRAYLTNMNGGLSDPVLSLARYHYKIESRRESDAPADSHDGIIGVPIKRQSWSASSLARIGSCPFKWFASDILRLNQPEEAETELPANVRGTLLHKALEIAAKRSLDAPDIRTAMLQALEEAFAEAEALHEPLTVVANWRLRRTEQVKKLERAILSDHFLDEGSVVIATEVPFEAEFDGLTIKGTIDRIDRCADGSLMAIDYKHSTYVGKIKDENGYLKVEIQLPIYVTIALPQLYPDTEYASGRFFHIADPKITMGKETDMGNVLAKIRSLLEQGRFAVDPDVKMDACTYCEFDVVCRVGPRLDLKRDNV